MSTRPSKVHSIWCVMLSVAWMDSSNTENYKNEILVCFEDETDADDYICKYKQNYINGYKYAVWADLSKVEFPMYKKKKVKK